MPRILATFLRGLGVVLPVAVTVWLLAWLVGATENTLRSAYVAVLPETLYFPGLGIVLGILLVYAVGVLMRVFVVERLWAWFEARFKRIPVVRTVYNAISDLFGFFSNKTAGGASRVVGVDLGDDIRLVGFITDEGPQAYLPAGDERIAVYVPMSYQVGGFTLLVPREKIEILDVPIEQAMRFVLTAGIRRSPGD